MSGLYDNLEVGSAAVKQEPTSARLNANSSDLYANLLHPKPETTEKPRRPYQHDRRAEPPRKKQMTRPLATTLPIPNLPQNFQTNALFVGNLKWWTRDQDLLNIFSQFGTVTALKIHADKINGKSKGYAYIEYSHDNPSAASQAKQKLHGFTLHGGKLTITFASLDKIKLPEFSNTPYSNPSAPIRGLPKLGAAGGMDLSALTGGMDLSSLPAINPVSLGLTNTDLLKKLNLGGPQGISTLLTSLKGKSRRSDSRSGSSYSRSPSRSRTYSRSRSHSPRKKTKRRAKKEREEHRGGRDRDRGKYRSRRDR